MNPRCIVKIIKGGEVKRMSIAFIHLYSENNTCEHRFMSLEKNPGILGIHHVTAITRNPQKNIDFYSGILGLRLVKLTVNFDEPTNYHLCYGDELGRPGSIITFFSWEYVQQGWRGTGQVNAISFLIPENAIEYWSNRLKDKGVGYIEPIKRFDNNEQVITFVDHDGVKLELVASKEAEHRKINAWKNGPIPVDYAIRGLHSVTLSLEVYEKTSSLLTDEMGFSKISDEGNRVRFQIKDRFKETLLNNFKMEKDQNSMHSTPSIVDIIVLPYSHRGTSGPGTVHHVAWQTPTDESQIEMRNRIIKVGLNATPIIDRNYFNSVYFREPGDILFEIATNTPGFLVDQKPEELGQKLILPKWLEYKRIYIEKTLPPIKLPSNENANA